MSDYPPATTDDAAPAGPSAAVPDGQTGAGQSEPLIVARNLSLRGARGRVFDQIDIDVPRRRLLVVTGRSGSGRSSLLLALAGRLRGLSGTGTFAGSVDLIKQPAKVARRASVARISGLIDLEPQLTVTDSVVERALSDGVGIDRAMVIVKQTADALDCRFNPAAAIIELSRLDRGRLALALACIRPADLIVFDDVDAHLDLAQQGLLYQALSLAAEAGPAVVATTVIPDIAPSHASMIALPDRLSVGRPGSAATTRPHQQEN